MPHHYFLTMSPATILFLTICATAPLSLQIIHGIHLIVFPAWLGRNSTAGLVTSVTEGLVAASNADLFCLPERGCVDGILARFPTLDPPSGLSSHGS